MFIMQGRPSPVPHSVPKNYLCVHVHTDVYVVTTYIHIRNSGNVSFIDQSTCTFYVLAKYEFTRFGKIRVHILPKCKRRP